MAHDEDLADRIPWAIQDQEGVTEKPMFGRLAFLVPSATASDQEFTRWIRVGVAYAGALPPK